MAALVKAGADPFLKDNDGVTALMSAAAQGLAAARKYLVALGERRRLDARLVVAVRRAALRGAAETPRRFPPGREPRLAGRARRRRPRHVLVRDWCWQHRLRVDLGIDEFRRHGAIPPALATAL